MISDENNRWNKLALQTREERLNKMENIKTLVTERPDAPEDGSIVKTPSGDANIQFVTRTVWAQVGIRVARTYVQALAGFIIAVETGAAAGVGVAVGIPASAFMSRFWIAAGMAAAPAVMALLQNVIELLSKMDETSPEFRA